ncbi:MAG: DUF512 domain-containing protein [Schwartzia sp. (in: firmicutes)]
MIGGKILRVKKNSIAEELGLVAGDTVLTVNGQRLLDIIDVSFAMAEEEIELLVEHEDGEQEMMAFDKDYDEELGVEFTSAVFDGIRQCANHCCFCFVDQVAPHMRDSLYIKDDDYRLSFLYGNFVTLTNLSDKDFQRIQQYHLSPLFVSVHTTNMALRAEMLGTSRAGRLMEQLERLAQAGITCHTQIVLCPGLNDGEELERTLRDLSAPRFGILSVAVVPVGLTQFRAGCAPLTLFDRAGADRVIKEVRRWQERLRRERGRTFVYLGDEFYLLAEAVFPPASEYDDFPQLDNGIGLVPNFLAEWEERAAKGGASYEEPLSLDVVCGTGVAPVFQRLIEALSLPHLTVRLVPVENAWFGRSVNVSGLLTGRDIEAALNALEGRRDGVIIPRCALRSGENVFLDDYPLEALRERLRVRVESALGGAELYDLLAHWGERETGDPSERFYTWQSNAAYTKLEDKHHE